MVHTYTDLVSFMSLQTTALFTSLSTWKSQNFMKFQVDQVMKRMFTYEQVYSESIQ